MAALEILWDYLGRSFDIEKKSFSAPDFDDKWGPCEEAEQEWEPKIRAALAQGKPCDTCKGTRVAPVPDEDLGGAGVTMSSCPDCVKPA